MPDLSASASTMPGRSSRCFELIFLPFGHAKSLGMITSLITNGLLLRQRAKDLNDLDFLSVSLDGIKSYRELRGIEPQEVVDGIEAAKAAGHEILMNCVISDKNIGELEDLVHLAESLGVRISLSLSMNRRA